MPTIPVPLIGMAFATLAALAWALALASTALLPAGFPTVELLWGRYTVHLVLLVMLVLPFRGADLVRTARPRVQLLRGATMLVMPFAFVFAVHRMNVALAWAALWTAPLLGAAFAQLAAIEADSVITGTLALVATAGSVLAHGVRRMPPLVGLAAAGVAAAAFGAFLVFTRMLRSERPATGLFWTAACVAVPVAAFVPGVWQPLTGRSALGVVAVGVLWMLVLWAFDEALRRAPLGTLVPFLLTEIVWEHLLLGGSWGRRAIVGGVVILGCAAWLIASAWRSRPSTTHLSTEPIG